jgi:LmbE family N-acetylglucosaminyl deacetylase
MRKYHGVHDISIVYQTTGRTAVSSSIVAYHREFLNTVFKTHSVSDATIGVAVRRIEAKTAAQICGITDVRFIEMPFYKRISKDRRSPHVENNDVELVLAILDEKQPTHIIINGDSDPNHTHDLCKTAITRAVARAQSRPNVYEYCSAWGEFALSEVALVIPLTKHQLKMKKRAILAHESQNPPLVHSGDPTPFHTRAVVNARDTLALLKKMGFTYHADVMGVEVLRAV